MQAQGLHLSLNKAPKGHVAMIPNDLPISPYFDVHCHREPAGPTRIGYILNAYKDMETLDYREDRYRSLGIHPCYIDRPEQQEAILRAHIDMPGVVALGECGLDKRSATPMTAQEGLFEMQIELANLHKKPLIIHCVRAFEESMRLLRAAKVPVLFHGFNKHPQLGQRLLDQGHYLSFGKDLGARSPHARQMLQRVPADRFFLETDDSALEIEKIYQMAATLRGTTLDSLTLQLQKNIEHVFSIR